MPIDNRVSYKIGSNTYYFTPRQSEILKRVVQGKNNKDIADELYIQVGSVKFHITNIFKKLGVKSRSEAIVKFLSKKA